jgi:hypothetical protein
VTQPAPEWGLDVVGRDLWGEWGGGFLLVGLAFGGLFEGCGMELWGLATEDRDGL